MGVLCVSQSCATADPRSTDLGWPCFAVFFASFTWAVWEAFIRFHDQGLIYRDHRGGSAVWLCSRDKAHVRVLYTFPWLLDRAGRCDGQKLILIRTTVL